MAKPNNFTPNPRAGRGSKALAKDVSASAVQDEVVKQPDSAAEETSSEANEQAVLGENLGADSEEVPSEPVQNLENEVPEVLQEALQAPSENVVAESEQKTDEEVLAKLMAFGEKAVAGNPETERIGEVLDYLEKTVVVDKARQGHPLEVVETQIIQTLPVEEIKKRYPDQFPVGEPGARVFSEEFINTAMKLTLGERPDGTYGVVVTVPEGYIEAIKGQAESDGVSVEEWCSIRMAEVMESWWQRAGSR